MQTDPRNGGRFIPALTGAPPIPSPVYILAWIVAWLSNIALPGTGLIVRDRPWLGLVLVLLFGICGHAAIVGTWVAPRQWPGWITTTAWLLLAAVWILAQTLYYQYCVRSRAPIFKENANGPERSNSH